MPEGLAALLLGLGLGAPFLTAEPSPPIPAPAHKSVRGKLQGIDKGAGAVNMTTVNLTGERVVLRTAAMVGDSCSNPVSGPASESVVPAGGRAEVQDGCWCCAPYGNTCTPGNKSGRGTAYLERCFE